MTMMMNERDREERFEADLRAAMAPEPAGADLKRRILEQAVPRNRTAARKQAGWAMLLDPRNWRLPVLVELGAVAAAASLAVGVFAGANGLLPNEFALGTAATNTASTGSNSVDLVALAYDDSSTSTDLAGGISGGLQ
jgi:anti-sigma-K factor RskA